MSKISTPKKVAIVYDWADTAYGGAEKVLFSLQRTYPQAVLFVPLADRRRAPWLSKFAQVRTGFLQRFPAWFKRKRTLCSLLLPLCVESFDLSEFELVISVASFAAKGVLTKPHQLHVCYLLTPTRFLYSHQKQYLNPLARFLAAPFLTYLRQWDQVAAWRPDYLIPISNLVAKRTQDFYHRHTLPVIYPPLIFSPPTGKIIKQDFYLAVGRLVTYKKTIVAVQACLETGVKLKIVGQGPELKKIKNLVKRYPSAKDKIEFLSKTSDAQLAQLYAEAKAIFMIGEEDFGLVALEANAAGTLVIGYAKSGALEILPETAKIALTNDGLLDTIQAIKKLEKRADLRAKSVANRYNQTQFIKKFTTQVDQLIAKV